MSVRFVTAAAVSWIVTAIESFQFGTRGDWWRMRSEVLAFAPPYCTASGHGENGQAPAIR